MTFNREGNPLKKMDIGVQSRQYYFCNSCVEPMDKNGYLLEEPERTEVLGIAEKYPDTVTLITFMTCECCQEEMQRQEDRKIEEERYYERMRYEEEQEEIERQRQGEREAYYRRRMEQEEEDRQQEEAERRKQQQNEERQRFGWGY